MLVARNIAGFHSNLSSGNNAKMPWLASIQFDLRPLVVGCEVLSHFPFHGRSLPRERPHPRRALLSAVCNASMEASIGFYYR